MAYRLKNAVQDELTTAFRRSNHRTGTTCAHCLLPIRQGSDYYYVLEVRGSVHLDCLPALQAARRQTAWLGR